MTFQILPTPGGTCINGVLTPGTLGAQQSIASPSGIARLIRQMAAVAAGATPGRGGGGGDEPTPPTPSCDIFIGVVTSAPAGGFGAGTVEKVTFHSDGSWSGNGQTVSVIFPKI